MPWSSKKIQPEKRVKEKRTSANTEGTIFSIGGSKGIMVTK